MGERRTALFALSLIVPLALYIGLAARLVMARVGYEMDEALYVESAVYMLRGSGTPPFVHEAASWIQVFGRRWPLMIIPYVGAAKAYVALPLFGILGIGTEVARLSGVLLGGLGIAGLVTLIGTQVSPAAGLIAGVFLGIHPSYLDLTIFDNGGVAVWMAAMGLAALALTNYLRRRSTLCALLLGIAAGLGIWARVNFLWLLTSVIVAALVVFGRRAVPPKRHLVALVAGGLLGSLPLILYEVASKLGTLRFISSTRQPLSGHLIAQRLRALAEVMISDREQRVIWGGPPVTSWEIGVGAGLLGLVLLALLAPIGSGHPAISQWRRAFALSAVLLAAILLTSRLHIQQHHLVAVLPLVFAGLAILSVEAARRLRPAIPVLAIAAAGLAVLYLSWDVRIDRGLRETGGRRAFSSAIDDVSRYLESHPVAPDRLKILNWGFQNNLYVVSRGTVYGTELFGGASKAVSRRGLSWESEIRDGGSFLVFLFPMGPPSLSDAAEGFSEALRDHPGPYREKLFFERSGIPYARLVEIDPADIRP